MKQHAMMLCFFTITMVMMACNSQPSLKQQITLYKNATILDLKAEKEIKAHIEVKGSKISRVISAGSSIETILENKDVKIIDLKNKYVLPALIDMHVHSWGNMSPEGNYQLTGAKGTANAHLYAGIGGFVDLFSGEDYIFDYRNKQFNQSDVEARLFAAGPCFTATDGHCSQMGTETRIINTPEQGVSELESLALKKPDVVKVVYDHIKRKDPLPTIDKETLKAFLTKAKQLGIKSIVHIGTWQDVREAAKAGASAITHTPMSKMPSDIPDVLLKNKVVMIPTLVVQTDWPQYLYKSEVLERPLLKALTTSEMLSEFPVNLDNKPRLKAWLDEHKQNNSYEFMDKAIKSLSDSGVMILAGSDAANITSFQGFSLHRELEHLVEAGVSTWKVLKGASIDAQSFLNIDWQIKAGNQAEFVVFNHSPITDIKNTQDIYAMIHKGEVVDRKVLLSNVTPSGLAKIKMYLHLQ